MCGIAGFLKRGPWPADRLRETASGMIETLAHRGPDGCGLWFDQDAGVALAHRRLAILDLSDAGRQPMESKDGRYVVTYNGEIYNYRELRAELEGLGHSFVSDCDTEVLLASVVQWGIGCVERFVGMFAFALWDGQERVLHLVRDRMGIKPLYYGWASGDGTFVFGSELKALKAHPGFDNGLDVSAMALFFRHNYIPGPLSIYRGVRKVMPGQMVSLSQEGLTAKAVDTHTFWSIEEKWKEGLASPLECTDEEAADMVEEIIRDAVGSRLISHVPLGAFLSGGIDSSAVTAVMQSIASGPVRTFSIGFEEARYDEAPFARKVAQHLGTDHTELYVRPEDALALIPRLPDVWDEPFADSSQIPTYLISRLTKEHVTVALSGDGGDELFWGYTRYPKTVQIWKILSHVPSGLKPTLSRLLEHVPARLLDGIGRIGRPVIERFHIGHTLSRVRNRLCELLAAEDFPSFYGWANSHVLPFGPLIPGSDAIASAFETLGASEGQEWAVMSLLDLMTYLPDDILTKVDRASMAVALEARVPLLDHRVAELSFRLPARLKYRDGKGKWILRQVLYRYVPEELVDRPKTGFGIPLAEWLRGPLRQWAEELVREDRLKQQGYLDTEGVRRLWSEHLSGECNHQYTLWNVLMFQAWLERWGA